MSDMDPDELEDEEAARRYWRRVDRINFWYGWIWGAACTSGFLLVVRLFWVTR